MKCTQRIYFSGFSPAKAVADVSRRLQAMVQQKRYIVLRHYPLKYHREHVPSTGGRVTPLEIPS